MMYKFGLAALIILFSLTIVACGPSVPILPAAPLATLPPLPSLAPPASPTLAPTVALPTQTATTTATLAPGQTITATRAAITTTTGSVTATATSRPATPTSAAAGFPPGIYVIDLKVSPEPAIRNADLTLMPTFVNSQPGPQNYTWVVYIYRTDSPSRSTGETARTTTSIPVGTSDQKPGSTWKFGPGNQCEFFFIQVGFQDQDRRINYFTKPDGKVFQKNLTLCP